MAVKRKPTIKATFETGDRPTQAEFGDFIDSYVPIETDGAVGFMEVISTASSLARPAETLVAIATGAQGGKVGVIEVLATADVTALPAGAVGREVLSADATASAQGHLGGGTAGIQVFEADTTAAAQDILGITTASETNFGVVEIATQAEVEAGTAVDRVVTAENLTDAMTLETPIVTTSGTAHDFTGIRASAKRITIMFNEVSLSGTDDFLIQIGPVADPETSGYIASSVFETGAGGANVVSSTAGFIVRGTNAGNVLSGHAVLTLFDPANDTWIESHTGKLFTGTTTHGGGSKSLADTLTQVRITRSGTDTFDAGSVNILVE